MKNDFVEYYGKHEISPVKQDIAEIEIHYKRRKKLYMQCGIPTLAFPNAEMLEVGPAGGYNTLAFLHWGCKHIDLVEPNLWGRKDMEKLFAMQHISQKRYEVFPVEIENYQANKKYDIIVAEGFLQNLYNQEDVINKLKNLTSDNGIVVVTCCDHVCFYVELMKRLVGWTLTSGIDEYEEKVGYLADFFAPQLANLKGVSRSPKEWVQDQILDAPNVNGTELSMSQAIDYFGEDFDVLGCSPQIFTNYSWYKDIWYNYKSDYKRQFREKRLSLLMANMPEIVLPTEKADILVKHFERIKKFELEYEKTMDMTNVKHIIDEMRMMEQLVRENMNEEFVCVFSEIKEVLVDIQAKKDIKMEKYPHFFSAFGRTQQYISFCKK